MKLRFSVFLFFMSVVVKGQDCRLLTQTFAIADTMKKESGELYLFRFSSNQLGQLKQMTGLEKPVVALEKLQKTLDQDNESLKAGTLWQLDEKLAEKQLAELRKECPETGFRVFEREIAYYRKRYKEKDAK